MYAIGMVVGNHKLSLIATRLPKKDEGLHEYLDQMIDEGLERGDDPFGVLFYEGKPVVAVDYARLPNQDESNDDKEEKDVRG